MGAVLACGLCVCASILRPTTQRRAWAAEPPSATPEALAPAAPLAGPTELTNSVAAAQATPMSADAKAHYDRGLELYAARRYLDAIEELDRGFAVEPRREFLFAEAQAWRLAGDCARATPLYHRFIESGAAPLQTEAARLGLERCAPGRAPAAQAQTQTQTQTQPPSPSLAKATPSPRDLERAPLPPAPQPWWRDAWGDATIAAGVIALGAAGGLYLASNRALDDAESSMIEPQYDRLWASAQNRRAGAAIALAGGAVLITAGVSRLFYVRHKAESGPARQAGADRLFLAVELNGAALWLRQSF